ncbi:MAG: ferredoxin--NADP reductase, partial [Calditrichia bacterium]
MAVAELNSVIAQKVEVAPGLSIFRILTDGWELPIFKPGQYTVLGLPGSAPRFVYSDPEPNPVDPVHLIKRAYSIASSSKEKEYIELYI